MGLLRRHDDAGTTRYQMREKLFAIGDDFWIDTEEERHAYKVNGKALRIRKTFVLEGPSGDELFKLREKKIAIRDTYGIEVAEGENDALILAAAICIDEMSRG